MKVMHKVLFITKRHYTNKDLVLDRFGRLFHLPIQLVQNGYICTIITADYQSNQVERYNISGLYFLSLPFRLRRLALFFYRCRQAIQQFTPEIIIASGDTHFGVIGLIYARLARVPFVFDVYDDYTTFGSNRPPGMKRLFWKVIKKADAVICSSAPLMQKLNRQNKSVTVIENGVDTNLFKPNSRQMAREKLHIDQKDIVIGYFGFMGPNYGIKELINATRKLRNIYPRVRLLLAGKKHDHISGFDHSNIDYRGVVNQKEIPLFINSSNVVVIPYRTDGQISLSNPCKLSEYLACGVPIVSTRVSNIPDILSDIPEALCNPGDADEMAKAIKWQLETPKLVPLPESLKWEALGKKFRQVLERLLAGQ